MKKKKNNVCSRCHTTQTKADFTSDATICNTCLLINPKGIPTKRVKSSKKCPDEFRFCETFGSAGLYN